MTTALTAASALSNPSGASPHKATPDVGDVAGSTVAWNANLAVIARNAHATLAKTVATKNAAGVTQTTISLAAGEVVVLGPFDEDTYGSTITLVPETTDIKFVALNTAPTLTTKAGLIAVKATVDAIRAAVGTVPGHKRALRRLSHMIAVATRRVNDVNPDPLSHI